MPKGIAEVTDQILITRLDRLDKPVTIKELVIRLEWSRGKIDGAIGRLQKKQKVAIVKVSIPKGQRRRYIGLPNKPYWGNFFQEKIIKQKNVLVNDDMGVLEPFHPESGYTEYLKYEELQNTINHLYQKLAEKDRRIKDLEQKFSENHIDFDPSIMKVIKENLHLITTAAKNLEVTPAKLLNTGILQITDPNFDLITKIVSVVVSASKSDVESSERTAAQNFLRRAGSLENI